MPMSSSGTCRAVRASRPQSLTDAASAHCRSSMASTTGRAAISSMISAISCSASVRRRAAHAERVEEREQRELLAELVARAPELLVASPLPVPRGLGGGRERTADEGGLADARLTLDEHRVATAPGKIIK